jgi:hypothetical protein
MNGYNRKFFGKNIFNNIKDETSKPQKKNKTLKRLY